MPNQPCCTGSATCHCVPFSNDKQEATYWCWAAVSTNVFNSMLPAGTASMHQCDLVNKIKGHRLGDPCVQGNKEKYLDANIGNVLDALRISHGLGDPVAFSTLVSELSGGAAGPVPVVAQIDFGNGAVHYIAICGVDTATNHIFVADPMYGGDPVELAFADLFSYGYQHQIPHPGGTGAAQILQRIQKLGSH